MINEPAEEEMKIRESIKTGFFILLIGFIVYILVRVFIWILLKII